MNYIQYMKPGNKFWTLPNGLEDMSWSEFWDNWKLAITKAKNQIGESWENLKQDYKDASDPISASEKRQAESIEATRAKQASMKFVSDNRTDYEKKRDVKNLELKEFEQEEQLNKDATNSFMWTLIGIPYAVQHLASPNGLVKTYGNTKAAIQNGGGPYIEKAIASAAGDALDAFIIASPMVFNEGRQLARELNKNVKNTTLQPTVADEAVLRWQLGWAPKQTIPYRHGSQLADLKTFVPKHDRWDVTTHGADPYMYFVTDLSTPVSAANMMDLRPYQYTGNIVAEKPMVQVGDFNIAGKNSTRNQLISRARQQGADTYLLQDIVDNKVPHLNVVARFIGPEGEAVQGGAASVKWYGPTMGKTTAAKVSDKIVDIDPLLKPIRTKHAERLGLKISDPQVSADPLYKQEVADFVLDWRANPENLGKTLTASTKHLLDPKYKVLFANEPSIPDFETFAARNKARGFKETDEQLRAWYNSILELGRELNVDNRFIMDIEGLTPTSQLQGDDAARMFNEYAKGYTLPATETENIRLLRSYVAEARERYGLVGNDNVSDETILKALYKHVDELGGNTAARNIDGEPQLLFRGDTKHYTTLMDHTTAPTHGEDLLLGTLFLGETPISGGGWGADRYLWKYDLYGNIIPVANSGVELAWSTQVIPVLKLDVFADDAGRAIFLYPNTKHQTVASSIFTGDIKKIPNQFMKDGYSNDLNAFVVRTKNVRDISDEVSAAMDLPDNKIRPDWFNFSESPIEGHYKSIVQSAKNKNLGLMRAKKHSPYRDEHENYTYMVVPDFNKQNAKHILPYDFRIPRNWLDPNIFRVVVPTALTLGGVSTATHKSTNNKLLN